MYRIIVSMREYWMLDVCKSFDPKFSFNNKTKPNLSIDYMIDEFPWPVEVREKLIASKREMLPLANALKNVRNKLISHRDLETHAQSRQKLFGKFKMRDERSFYRALLSFLNTVDGAVLGAPPLSWPSFAESDAREFIGVLAKAGYARKE